jgi:hypothetical protein
MGLKVEELYSYYGFYPHDPFLFDTVTYEVPYKIAFFERGRCTGWEISS